MKVDQVDEADMTPEAWASFAAQDCMAAVHEALAEVARREGLGSHTPPDARYRYLYSTAPKQKPRRGRPPKAASGEIQ